MIMSKKTNNKNNKELSIHGHDSVTVSDHIAVKKESCYLLQSHRDKAKELIAHSELNQHDIMDVLISLHIVLEIGINTFFRQILPVKKGRDVFAFDKTTENLDNINFGDKVATFVYSSDFNFNGKEEQAQEYHKIIKEIKRSSEMRNRLLHGHAISSLYEDGKSKHSTLSKKLNLKTMGQQIKSFRTILEGLAFYFQCYTQGGFTPAGKEKLIKAYLDTSFLPHGHFDSE